MKHNKTTPWPKPASDDSSATPANPGPVTAAGKEVSSRNALKHGCSSNGTLLLPNENRADFHALETIWFRAYAPQDDAERQLIHELVEADWFRQRAVRNCATVEAQIFAQSPNPIDWTDLHHKALSRFLRYRTAHSNDVIKKRKAVEQYRRNRQMEQSRSNADEHKQARLALAEAKIEILKIAQAHTIERGAKRRLENRPAEKQSVTAPAP